jgi:FMN phosphatase YigB (HAD superfamily)
MAQTSSATNRGPLKLVIFDMDGILVDNVAYEEKNLEYIADILVEQEGISYVEAQDRLDAISLKYRGKREAHDWRVLTKELNLGNVWYDAHLANLKYLTVISGVEDLLKSLKGKVPMVIGSDAIRPVAEIKLSYGGIKRYFDTIYTQDDVNSFKGEPSFYQRISEDQGIPLGSMMYVGNRPERGINTAQGLGMYTILVPHPEYLQLREKIPANVHPDLETKDLEEVRDFILKHIERSATK